MQKDAATQELSRLLSLARQERRQLGQTSNEEREQGRERLRALDEEMQHLLAALPPQQDDEAEAELRKVMLMYGGHFRVLRSAAVKRYGTALNTAERAALAPGLLPVRACRRCTASVTHDGVSYFCPNCLNTDA